MNDFYLEHPEELKGQPKRTIADYVEANGILVPRRFDSLEEARKSKKAIILRSEHPQEYDGASGILDSPTLSSTYAHASEENPQKNIHFSPRSLKSVKDVKDAFFEYEDNSLGSTQYMQYCEFLGISPEKFKQETSFSIWEKLRGHNRFIVADSAVPGRYHITTDRPGKKGHYSYMYNYAVVDNGKITQQHVKPLTRELKKGLENLIQLYESVRNLERFDPNHCPIIEVQTSNGKNYFLQYHRTRDFEPATFVLDRKPRKGEIEAPFVRGATSELGMCCKTTLIHAGSLRFDFDIHADEEGSFDTHWCRVYSELMARKRKLQIIPMSSEKKLGFSLMKFVVHHDTLTKLFKPQVSIPLDVSLLFSDKEYTKLVKRGIKKGQDQHLNLYVISDGRKAYIKRIK
jgi:hypothetical protein